MLKIQNNQKLVGETFDIGLDVWRVEGVYEYLPQNQYQIHLRTSGNKGDKLFILTKEEKFAIGNARYKIMDRDDTFNSIWVNWANISTITSMLRTLKRILSHAYNS
jgi:hypothetical protein